MTKLPTSIAVLSAAILFTTVSFFQVAQKTEATKRPALNPAVLVPAGLSPETSIYTQSQRIIGSTADEFGNSVAISGNYAVVGAHIYTGTLQKQGAAFVYVRDGGTWMLQDTLISPTPAAFDDFGFSVDISGDRIVVGAPGVDEVVSGMSVADRGAAYVFERNGTTWSPVRTLTNEPVTGDPDNSGEEFGYSVGIDGNTIVVGSPEDKTDNDNFNRANGSITIFEYISSTWTRRLKSSPRFASGSATNDLKFGRSVAISGNNVIAGGDQCTPSPITAPNSPTAERPFECLMSLQGVAAIYSKVSTVWSFSTYMTSSPSSSFGKSVAIDGTTAVIGAWSSAKAYVSEFSGSSWSAPSELLGGTNRNVFGRAVAVDGDMLVVANQPSGSVRSRAYVFRYVNGAWTFKAEIFQKHLSSSVPDGLGNAVAIDANRIIIRATGSAAIFQNIESRPYDFLNDASSDLSLFRPSTGVWYHANPGGSSNQAPYGTSGDVPVPADYDGDGKTDFGVYRPSTGVWYASRSTDGQSMSYAIGANGDYPIPNDFDNDGKADMAMFTPSTGTWQWLRSSDSTHEYAPLSFGTTGDIPILADFDGDGRGELAIFRSSAGGTCPTSSSFWSYNLTTSTAGAYCFGTPGDKPAMGDFDGDAKTDISIYRSSNNSWWRINSSNSATVTATFGSSGDIPAVADFDGDGESDIAVFRPSTNVWYVINSGWPDNASGSQYTIQAYGSSGDIPVPAAYNY